MKPLKIQSYIRLVLGFFILLASFNIVQFVFMRLLVLQNVPYYLKERHDVLLNIKNNIVDQAAHNPHFNLNRYLAKQNKMYQRLKLDFITEDEVDLHKLSRKNRDNFFLRVILPRRHNRVASAIKLDLHGKNGYLVLYHANEYNRLNYGAWTLTFFMMASISISLLAGFIIFRRIYRRSSQLVSAVQKIAEGDYSVRTSIPGVDEFSILGKAFNEMAASIEKSTQELKAADQQRRQFIADISHELSTPLTSIQGFVETLQMDDLQLSAAEQREYLKIVWDETERLTYLVKDLLELARMDAGTIHLMRDQIDCRQFLKEFSKRNALKLIEKKVKLIWKADVGQFIYADYRRLEQIFQNLLDNALKHSGELQQIFVTLTEEAGKTKILFRDDGCGIAQEHLSRIFDSFYKASSAPDQGFSSKGLGLSIVKQMVELHGGTITVDSTIQQGTTFTLIFPHKQYM